MLHGKNSTNKSGNKQLASREGSRYLAIKWEYTLNKLMKEEPRLWIDFQTMIYCISGHICKSKLLSFQKINHVIDSYKQLAKHSSPRVEHVLYKPSSTFVLKVWRKINVELELVISVKKSLIFIDSKNGSCECTEFLVELIKKLINIKMVPSNLHRAVASTLFETILRRLF